MNPMGLAELEFLGGVDWSQLFAPSQPLVETIIRGTATYLALFLLLRIFRRQTGQVGPADLLVLLLIADASQNALAGQYRSVTDGVLLVAVIIGWEYLLDLLAYYVPSVRPWLEKSPLPLIRGGTTLEKNLARELITPEDLDSYLREQGIERLSEVKEARLEGNGHITVIKNRPDVM